MTGVLARTASAALLAMALTACGSSEAKNPTTAAPPAPLPVALATAEARRLPGELEVTGTLTADAQTEIAAELAGRVVSVHVERGSTVNAGTVVARLDADDARHALAEAEALEGQTAARLGLAPGQTFDATLTPDARKARAALERAEAEHARYRQLVEGGLVSRSDYDLRYTELLTARAQYEAELNGARQLYQTLLAQRARAAMARKGLADAAVRAPFDGLVAERHVAVGQYVARGARVATIVRVDPLRVELSVPESAVASVRRGQNVSFTVQAYPERPFEGKVAWVGPSVRPDSRALVVEAVVPNAGGRLPPGLFVTARIELPAVRPAVLVPAAAVRSQAGLSSVFVVKNERAEQRLVQVGRRLEGQVEIERGLTAGEAVAVTALDRLQDGAQVTPGTR